MSDTFLPEPQVAPPAPMTMLPPAPSELLKAMSEAPPELTPEVSARDRLIVGAKVAAGKPTTKNYLPASDTWTQAQELTGRVGRVTPQLVNVSARLDQHQTMMTDPDRAADGWRRVAAAKHLISGPIKEKLTRFLGGDALKDDEWEDTSLGVKQIADALDPIEDDLTVGHGRVVGIDRQPEGAFVAVEYDDLDDVDKLPLSTTGLPGVSLPASTLKQKTKGFTVIAGPSDVVYATKPTPEADRVLRNLFPGPVGDDGVPRYVAVEPLPLRDHSVFEAHQISDPHSLLEAYADKGGYPGTKPGDWIAFDIPDQGWKEPSWAKGKVSSVKAGVARTAPEFDMTPVRRDELSSVKDVNTRLQSHAWAVLQPQGNPQATARMLATLKKRGVEPIELAGGDKAWLAFGVSSEDAAALSPKRAAFVNDGVVGADDEIEAPEWHLRTVDGTEVPLVLDGAPTPAVVSRVNRRARRAMIQVDPQDAKRVHQLAAELEMRGATGTAIYSRNQSIEGFEQAREHVYSDGVSLKVARTRCPVIGEPHSVPVWVRSTAGLPEVPPDAARAIVDPIPVLGAGRIRVDAEGDLAQASRQAAVLAQKYGYDRVHIKTPDGEVKLYKPR